MMEYQPSNQEVENAIEQQQKENLGSIPSNTSPVKIKKISIEKLSAMRKKLIDKLDVSNHKSVGDIKFKKFSNKLNYFSTIMGHSRCLDPIEFIYTCSSSFNFGDKIPEKQWLSLRSTHFPYQSLSAAEESAIKVNWEKIAEYAISQGINIVTIYLVLKKLLRTKQEKSVVIIQSGGGDVAYGNSIIDKRQEGKYINSNELLNTKLVEQKTAGSIEIEFTPPTDNSPYKVVTLVIPPDVPNQYSVFTSAYPYINKEMSFHLSDKLLSAETELEICYIAHLLGIIGTLDDLAFKKIKELISTQQETVCSVLLDILGNSKDEKAVEILVEQINNKDSKKLNEIAMLSLFRIGSPRTIREVCKKLIDEPSNYFIRRMVAEIADKPLIEYVLSYTKKMEKENLINASVFLSETSPSLILPIMFEELQNCDDIKYSNVISQTLSFLHQYHPAYQQEITSKLNHFSHDGNPFVATTAVDTLLSIASSSGRIDVLNYVSESTNDLVRETVIQYLETRSISEAQIMLTRMLKDEKLSSRRLFGININIFKGKI